MQTVHTPLNVWLGVCHHCVRPVRVEVDGEALPPAGKHTDRMTDCVECGRPVLAKRLWGMLTDGSCDGRCMSALGNVCSCSCGGKNHGKWFAERTYREVLETEPLRRYREEQIKLAQKRQAKAERETRKRVDIFKAWAASNQDVVDWLMTAQGWDTEGPGSKDQFLWDMLELVRLSKPLTPNQTNAVRRIRDARERQAQRREAERKAVTEPLPIGRVEITGEVVSTKSQDGDFGPVWKMLVKGDGGWKVWTTIPRDLLSQLDEENRKADPHGRGYTAQLDELRERRVTFTVTVEQSKQDPIFGYGKRPAKAKLLPVG